MVFESSTSHESNSSLLINPDEEHLRLLSIYHLIVSGIYVGILVIFVLIPLLTGPGKTLNGNPIIPERLIYHLITRGILALLIFLNGWSFKHRRYWLSCCLLSIFECSTFTLLNDPIGPILGISSVLVLRRKTIKTLMQHR
jgi:hypothetical protein